MTAASASAEEYASLLESGSSISEESPCEAVPSLPRPLSEHASSHDRRMRLPPGTRIGDHLIVRGVLGEGGTAVVYEALHTRLGASVALKVIDVADEFMEGARARLLREAHVCASLEDPHIPRIYDVGELPDGTPYVVMERVSGRTLENVLLQGALPLDIAVQITEDLLVAVDAIERAGIVHRDIKPPNIILQTNAEGMLRIRLMDFGVSKNVGAEREPTEKFQIDTNPTLTQQGAIVGTPHYMAPEQIVGPAVDSRADLYAVGVVAYEMMSGQTAFEGETTGDVVAAVLHTRPLPLRRLREVHEALESWVDKSMSQRRADRYQSARQMREALREAWESHLEQVGNRGQRRWAKRARVAGALGLVAIGMMLPVPSSYETGLGAWLGRTPTPTTNASTSAGPLALPLREAAAAVGAGPSATVAEDAHKPLPGESEWDFAQAVQASAKAMADVAAPRSREERPAPPALIGQPVAPAPTYAPPVTSVVLGTAVPTTPGALLGKRAVMARPAQPAPPAQAAAPAAIAAQPSAARPVPASTAPSAIERKVFGGITAKPIAPTGNLASEYVRKLDSTTGLAAPARSTSSYDKSLPENPFEDD